MTTTDIRLTRAEDAYAHLASFQRSDLVDIDGPSFYMPGTVTETQQPGETLEDACLVVTGTAGTGSARQKIRVSDLLSGDRTINRRTDVVAGNIRYFGAAGYATQNPEA